MVERAGFGGHVADTFGIEVLVLDRRQGGRPAGGGGGDVDDRGELCRRCDEGRPQRLGGNFIAGEEQQRHLCT